MGRAGGVEGCQPGGPAAEGLHAHPACSDWNGMLEADESIFNASESSRQK